jgi:hypothetical protein
MLIGAHTIIYSTNPDADRAFLRDVLAFSNVDLGGGWLVFGLPDSELAVHPASESGAVEFYLMCDDVQAFIADMRAHDIVCDPVHEERWGLLMRLTLPGGGHLNVYEPRHARPPTMSVAKPAPKRKPAKRKSAPKPAKKSAAKKAAKPAPKKPAPKKPAPKKPAPKKPAPKTKKRKR